MLMCTLHKGSLQIKMTNKRKTIVLKMYLYLYTDKIGDKGLDSPERESETQLHDMTPLSNNNTVTSQLYNAAYYHNIIIKNCVCIEWRLFLHIW